MRKTRGLKKALNFNRSTIKFVVYITDMEENSPWIGYLVSILKERQQLKKIGFSGGIIPRSQSP
jgi:hypothetical protein